MLLTSAAFLATPIWLGFGEIHAGPAALWPSVLAVGLAFLTRDIYLALFLGAFSGAWLLHGGNPWLAFQDLVGERLILALTDRWNMSVLVFTLLMGGFVEVLNRNGSMEALSARWLKGGANPRRSGMGAFILGWVLFIDGLANAMLVGKTLRPAADRSGLSREKLAFIVDATSSPIAGLALISTWVAYEMSVIRQGLENAGGSALAEAVAPFSWLVMSLPYRFYNWFMLLIVFLVVWLMRDWGPMLAAERTARLNRDHESGPTSTTTAEESSPALAMIPLTLLVLGVFGGLYISGGGLGQAFTGLNLVKALGRADAAGVFVVATAGATLVALLVSACWPKPSGGGRDGGRTAPVAVFLEGMQRMFLPALILVCAWMLNSVLKELKAADFLVALLGEGLPAQGLPAGVFALSALVSFSTGTSWGTMAIVMPLAIPLAVGLTGYQAGGVESPILLATVGAVLAGAVFGDHCSPISDTTLVSAFSSECEVMAHVRTQLPYALTAAVLAVLAGYGPAGWGVPPVALLLAGAATCWALVRYVGRAVE